MHTGLVVCGRKADVVEERTQAGLVIADKEAGALDLVGLRVHARDDFTLEADHARHIELQPYTAHNLVYPP